MLETVSVFVIIIFFVIGLFLSLFPKTEYYIQKKRTPWLIEIPIVQIKGHVTIQGFIKVK